jgi:hypothetical protein
VERRLAREHLVQHDAQAVDVAAWTDFRLARRLFRAHVGGGADAGAGLGQLLAGTGGGAQGAGDAEVGHQGVAVGEEDVLGLDVAVDDAALVGIVAGVGSLPHDATGLVNGQVLLPLVPSAELDRTVDGLVKHLLAGGPQAHAKIKDLIHSVANAPLDDDQMADTARRIAEIRVSPEGREGIASFLEKRKAAWCSGKS